MNRDQKIIGHPTIKEKQLICTIEVINLGKNPVSLQKVGLFYNRIDKPISIFSSSFGDYHQKILTQEQPRTEIPAIQEGLDFNDVIYVWARDNKGKEYRKYLSRIPTIKLLILKIRKFFK